MPIKIVIREEIFIQGLPDSVKEIFGKENTFDNPEKGAFAERMKRWLDKSNLEAIEDESKKNAWTKKHRAVLWTLNKKPSHISLCREKAGWLALPRGYLRDVTKTLKEWGMEYELEDRTICPELSIPRLSITGDLFDYQTNGLNDLEKDFTGTLEGPCGSGKTNTLLALASHVGTPTLICVHTDGLFTQTVARCRAWLDYDPGIISGKKKHRIEDITVAMIQSLQRMDITKEHPLYNRFGCVIVDECLDANTMVSTPSGLIKLGDLSVGDEVCTPFGSRSKIMRIWHKKAIAHEYVYDNGKSLIASENHLVLCRDRYGDELSPIVTARSLFECGNPHLNPLPYSEEDYLVGWIYGDGTITKNQIKFAFRKPEKIELFRKQFSSICQEFTNKRGDTVFTIKHQYASFLRDHYNLPIGRKAHIISIHPELLKRNSVGVVRGIMDADASRTTSRIVIDLTSEVCIDQIKTIIEFYGISAKTDKEIRRENDKHHSRWRLTIRGHNINRYNAFFGWGIHKKDVGQKALEWRRNNKKIQLNDIIPLGRRKLIDIEIDDNRHLFIANGIIVSNCHHSPALTWSGLLRRLPYRYKYGFSATAWRKDHLEFLIWRMIGPITAKIYAKEVEDAGRMVWPEIRVVKTNYSFDIEEGDTSRWGEMITDLISNEERNWLITNTISHYMANPDSKGLVLTDRIEHANILGRMCAPMDPVVLTGDLGTKDRREAMGKIRAGARLTIATIHLLGEGIDVPGWDVEFLVSPFSGGPRAVQAAGRVARPAPGKDRSLLIDFVDEKIPMLQAAAWSRLSLFKNKGERKRAYGKQNASKRI